MKILTVELAVGHPYRFKPRPAQLERAFAEQFAGGLAGMPATLAGIEHRAHNTVLRVAVEVPDALRASDKEVIGWVACALRRPRGGGPALLWTFAGWEAWFIKTIWGRA